MTAIVATVLVGVAAARVVALLVPPQPRLAARTRPYLLELRGAWVPPGRGHDPRQALGDLVDRVSRDEEARAVLALRLAQSQLLPEVPAHQRVTEFRLRQLSSAAVFALAFAAAATVAGLGAMGTSLAVALGGITGPARWRGALDRAISARCERIRIELSTVNQLLALHARVGGGVAQAVQRVVARGQGVVVEELKEVLRAHRGGRGIGAALDEAARATPEPHAARTYRLLARGADYGADLAEGLRALSDDLRTQRREALVRTATRRRAAMLLPIIGLLAPVMLLFVAAPLPSIVFGSR